MSRRHFGVGHPSYTVNDGLLTTGCVVKATNAQLVPAYAYDQRLSNVVYIRDKESDKGNGYMQPSQGNCRPSGIYQFSTLKGM
jgi:hypothetical protein